MIITKNSDKNAFYDSYVFLYGHPGSPSLINTEFSDSMLERQINWFTVA